MLLYTLIMSFVNLELLKGLIDASPYLKNSPLLKLDHKFHYYYYDGNKINASISQLHTFSYHFYKQFKIDEEVKKRAMEKGKTIHKLIEKHLSNKYPVQELIESFNTWYPSLQELSQPWISGVDEFIKKYELITFATELKLVDAEAKVAGSIDYIGLQKSTNTIFIVDWKTGKFTTDNLELWKYKAQLIDYKDLFRSNFNFKLNIRLFLLYNENKELEIKW